jgi:aspartate-semialdehyde dehydrogenase
MTQPYQKHSDTSRMAAESLETAETMEGEILALLASAGAEGMIGDDIALVLAKSHPTLQSGTIAARLRGLELKGKACQTIHTRLTRNNRQAHVWKLPEHTLKMEVLPAQDKPEQAMIDRLKKSGFKWSPRNVAWQRQLTPNAVRVVPYVLQAESVS